MLPGFFSASNQFRFPFDTLLESKVPSTADATLRHLSFRGDKLWIR